MGVRTLNRRVVMALTHSICKQKTIKYQHRNCSSCMIYVDGSSPSVQSQFLGHRALDQKPIRLKTLSKIRNI